MGRPKGSKTKNRKEIPSSLVNKLTKETLSETSTEPGQPKVQSGLQELKDRVEERKANETQEQPEKETAYQRKKREKEQNEQQALQSIRGGLSLATDLILDVVCVRLPNPKPATETEKQIFNQASEALINKYLPMILPYAVEIGFAVALGVVVVPRLKKEEPTKKENDDNSAAKSDTGLRENGDREKQVSEETAT